MALRDKSEQELFEFTAQIQDSAAFCMRELVMFRIFHSRRCEGRQASQWRHKLAQMRPQVWYIDTSVWMAGAIQVLDLQDNHEFDRPGEPRTKFDWYVAANSYFWWVQPERHLREDFYGESQ